MGIRLGFGDKTGESEEGNLAHYENGHMDVSSQAHRHITEEYPTDSFAVGLGKALIEEVAGEELSELVDDS